MPKLTLIYILVLKFLYIFTFFSSYALAEKVKIRDDFLEELNKMGIQVNDVANPEKVIIEKNEQESSVSINENLKKDLESNFYSNSDNQIYNPLFSEKYNIEVLDEQNKLNKNADLDQDKSEYLIENKLKNGDLSYTTQDLLENSNMNFKDIESCKANNDENILINSPNDAINDEYDLNDNIDNISALSIENDSVNNKLEGENEIDNQSQVAGKNDENNTNINKKDIKAALNNNAEAKTLNTKQKDSKANIKSQIKEKSKEDKSQEKNNNLNKQNNSDDDKFVLPDSKTVEMIMNSIKKDNQKDDNSEDNSDRSIYQEIIPRPIYDYRTTMLPDSINKKQYGENNEHLPKAFYNDEYSALLFVAIAKNNVSDIKALLKKNADINAQDSRNGFTPLMYAVKTSKLNALRYLITKGADVNHQAFDGKTALHLAIISNNVKASKILLASNAKITLEDDQNKKPYDYIKKNKEIIMLDFAKSYEDMNKAIIDFSSLNSVEGVEYAISKGANINYKSGEYQGDSAIIIAVRNNNAAIVNLLISSGANPMQSNKNGESAYSIADQAEDKNILNVIKTAVLKKDLENIMRYEDDQYQIQKIQNK